MSVVRFYAFDYKSGNPMHWHGVGLTLSYSFSE